MSPLKITFHVLQERFIAGLDRRLARLDGCLKNLHDSVDDAARVASIDEMTLAFHSLIGIGATFGFHQITEIARLGERACNARDATITAQQVRALADIIDSLRLEALAAAATVAPSGE